MKFHFQLLFFVLLCCSPADGFGQELLNFRSKNFIYEIPFSSESLKEQAYALAIRPVLDDQETMYIAEIRDVLGENFQTEEDLNVRIGASNLKYNIGPTKKSITLAFGTDKEGAYSYAIHGFFRHIDGTRYSISGTGTVHVTNGRCFDLFLGSIDSTNKTATVYLGLCLN